VVAQLESYTMNSQLTRRDAGSASPTISLSFSDTRMLACIDKCNIYKDALSLSDFYFSDCKFLEVQGYRYLLMLIAIKPLSSLTHP